MQRIVEEAERIFQAAIRSVRPDVLLGDFDLASITSRSLESYRRVLVLGVGKASLAMASVLEERLEGRIDGGFVATARGYPNSLPDEFTRPSRIDIGEGGHPLPDAGSVQSARRVLEIARRAERDDLVVALVSGGGSSVCTDFFGGVSLDDARATFRRLMEAGLDIYALNAVRKQMSTIAGGRLAAAIRPAEGVALIISDVVGDDPSVIASGPTVDEQSTPEEAVRVLKKAGVWGDVPEPVRAFFRDLLENSDAPREARRSHGDEITTSGTLTTRMLASNETALDGAADEAKRMGYDVRVVERGLTGEAREIGSRLAERVLSNGGSMRRCYLAGGETSVTLRGHGRGGRNQELALAAGLELSRHEGRAVFLSGGTDGIDGPTDAAGAVVTHETITDARERGIDPMRYLDANDSYSFFEQMGGLIITGPTHTNVMDVQIIIA